MASERTGTRKEQKAQTRERIIAAAFKVYSQAGFSASTSAITDEAGISHGAIFVHFPTVESLLLCLLDIFGQEMANELHSLSKSSDMENLLRMHLGVLARHEAFYRRLVSESALLPVEARNTLVAINSTLSIHFQHMLQPQMALGQIKPIPLAMIFNTWLGLVHYYLLNGDLFAPGQPVLESCADTLVNSYLVLIGN